MSALRSWIASNGVRALLWLALSLALFASLAHVAWGFSTLSGGDMFLGYVQAVALDVGLGALSLGIQQRRAAGKPVLRLWVGVLLFAGISTYVNLIYGFAHLAELNLRSDAPLWLDMVRPYFMSGVLPIMVVYLSEIVSEGREPAPAVVDSNPVAVPAAASVVAASIPLDHDLSDPSSSVQVADFQIAMFTGQSAESSALMPAVNGGNGQLSAVK